MAGPFPDITISGIPTQGESCLWQLHKFAEGDRQVDLGDVYRCDLGPTQRGFIKDWRLPLTKPDPNCTETDLIPDGSLLVTTGPFIYRGDGLAIYSGKFEILDPSGRPLFFGQLELYERIGTHHAPVSSVGEACREHIEGWLVGEGAPGLLPNHALHLAIAGVLADPRGKGPSGFVRLILNGVLIKSP
jgi:hypothetical protein